MPESRIIEETPCDGCGYYFAEKDNHVRASDNEKGFERCPGSGGSRRLLVRTQPDLKAAGRVLANRWENTAAQSPGGVTSKHVGHWVHDILDAGLAGGWLVKEEE